MINQYNTLVEAFGTEYQKFALKPTKASSKRLRALINQMKKIATPTKQALVESDAVGY